MKYPLLLVFIFAGFLASCQPVNDSAPKVTILNGDKNIVVDRTVDSVEALLISAGVSFTPDDLLIVNGMPFLKGEPLPDGPTIIQIRKAVPIQLDKNGEKISLKSSAFTVGEVLEHNGITLNNGDYISPPPSTPILGALTIEYRPASEVEILTSAGSQKILTSAQTVGAALAEAGIPLQGLDYSDPEENAPLPDNGRIKVVRVNEAVALVQKSIDYTTEVQLTADLELDQQELLQVGEPGLAVTRTRIRYEDGQEVSQQTDDEALVRPAKDRIIGAGTKIVIRTVDTPDGPLEYYRAIQVYATSYSPCRLGVPRCGYGTAGGLKAQKGVIGVIRSWWRYMNGDPVYIPGYGRAIISDIGAGIDGRYWIDLAYSDDDYVPWHSWTTLYFLTPVPATVMYVLE